MNDMITIITPTYNRAHTLAKCYESLCKQSCKDFKWLLVDDGSNDGTDDLVQSWIEEQKISVIYLKKTNGGKASALNYALPYIDTPFCCVLDSDDYFVDDAIENVIPLLMTVESDNNCCGVIALRNNPDGDVMGGKRIPEKYKYASGTDLMLKLNLHSEYVEFMKTDLVKQFPYPSFENEKFISPAYLDYKISDNHKFLVSQEKICICEYFEDGLTRNKRKIIINNPKGYTLIKQMSYDRAPNIQQMIKQGVMYNYGCIIGKDKDWLKNAPHKLLTVMLRPAGYIVLLLFKRSRA